jgi:ankyrin repeat protein
LLAHGARLGSLDSQHRSALHWAVVHRREALLKLLLKHSVRVGERSVIDGYDTHGKTPLHTAIDTGFEAGVQVLLQYGANVHFKAGVP